LTGENICEILIDEVSFVGASGYIDIYEGMPQYHWITKGDREVGLHYVLKKFILKFMSPMEMALFHLLLLGGVLAGIGVINSAVPLTTQTSYWLVMISFLLKTWRINQLKR
jgi:hypothetical protein